MPLQLACISDNNIAVVQYLIDRGADVNAQRWSKKHSTDKSQAVAGAIGSTALHVACANGCVRIVDLLLRNDASVHLKDKYGSRPIDIALAKHHTEIVKLLETFGALQEQNEAIEASQQRQQNVRKRPSIMSAAGRRSMDVWDQRAERMRRPSLPSVFE
ncbi:ankyrin repeat-containing domain protein, partial [Gongronella butleri]